jgi:hypothetical protein
VGIAVGINEQEKKRLCHPSKGLFAAAQFALGGAIDLRATERVERPRRPRVGPTEFIDHFLAELAKIRCQLAEARS